MKNEQPIEEAPLKILEEFLEGNINKNKMDGATKNLIIAAMITFAELQTKNHLYLIKVEDKLPFEYEEILIVQKSTNGEFFHFDLGYMFLKNEIPNYIKRATDFNVENENWEVIGYYELPATSKIQSSLE